MEKVLEGFKKVGSRLAFEFALEMAHDKLVDGLKEWLAKFTDDQLRDMVTHNKFPPVPPDVFSEAAGFIDYIEKIPLLRLVEEYLGPARPSLITILENAGDKGAAYCVNLHAYLLECIRAPEQIKVTEPEKPSIEIITVTCVECKKSFPVKKEDIPKIKECPFCKKSTAA